MIYIQKIIMVFHITLIVLVPCMANLDWIIKGIKGEIYPCKPDIFEATYEKVS